MRESKKSELARNASKRDAESMAPTMLKLVLRFIEPEAGRSFDRADFAARGLAAAGPADGR